MAIYLSDRDVGQVLAVDQVIDAVRQAHVEHASGKASQPPRAAMALPGGGAMFAMPAALGAAGLASFKLMSDIPVKTAGARPRQSSNIVVLDTESGELRAVLEGGVITALRTAAASAVATQALMSDLEAPVLGFIGAGRLALKHLEALRSVLAVVEVNVWSRSRATVEAFLTATAADGLEVRVCDGPEEVIRRANIVSTLTPSREPIVQGRWLRAGQHLNVAGAPPFITHREVDTEAVVRSRIVVDSREAMEIESGDMMIPVHEGAIDARHFADELGEVLAGVKQGRSDAAQITMYKSIGVAIQDLATAALAIERAAALGIGMELPGH